MTAKRNRSNLHVTLMNSRKQLKLQTTKQPFDAKLIMEKFGNFNFGVCSFNDLHLSLRPHNEAVDETTGYYKAAHVLNLNLS